MSEDKSLTKIPHSDGVHYDHWGELMENFLRSKGLWSLIENGFEEPRTETGLTDVQLSLLDDTRTKDHKVKHYLYQAIDRVTFEQILDRHNSKVVWDSLKRKFGGNARVKRSLLQALRRDFEVLEMKKSETITEYFARVMAVANKMRSNGETMPDSKVVEKILRTLTERFTYVVVSIEESKDTDTLSIDELQNSLAVHEQKFHRLNREEEDQALKIEDRTDARGRGRATLRGRGRGKRRQSFNRATVECFKCHNLGHFQYECPKWNKEANYAQLDEEDELLLMSYVEMHEAKRSNAWLLDSGCSNHMCSDQGMFLSLDVGFTHSVKLGNNTRMSVAGKGSVRLVFNGAAFVVGDVYYFSDLRNNLLSIGQLQEKGLAILIRDGACSIYHPQRGLIVYTLMSANRMFIILNKASASMRSLPQPEECFHTSSSDLTYLWHQRYGHLSHKGLRTLQFRKMVHGLPQFRASRVVCTDCFNGKQHRNAIPKRSLWRASQVLELIHEDICRPISPASNSGKRYTMFYR